MLDTEKEHSCRNTVRVHLPDGVKPKRVRLLAAGKTIGTKRDGEFLVATVPSVLDHEVLAVEIL